MKIYQKTSFTLIFLLVVTLGRAQNLTFGWTINLGPSIVTSNERGAGTLKTKAAFSGNFGVFLEKKLGKNAYLGIEGLWVQMEGFEVDENIEYYESYGEDFIKVGFITEEYKYHTSYLGLPIYLRYEIGKLGILGGVQTLFLLKTSTHFRSYGELKGEPFDSEGKMDPLILTTLDFGPKIGIDYQISPKLSLRMDYYHGIQDITADRWEWIRKNRQLGIGISYIFCKKEDLVVE
ncbi:MAG TPA: outer membrane beta-barrel protein [Saprospiraceae bacterium]|nr:outer membrane beta-barrel protein [Saprospiraceae bacterium]